MSYNNQKNILAAGELLLDIFQENKYENTGGAPFNFSCHIYNLLEDVIFISRIGNDASGQKIKEFINKTGFPLNHIQVDNKYPTGTVRVSLNKQAVPNFDIIKDVAYDYINLEEDVKEKIIKLNNKNTLIYFGTLAQRSLVSRKVIRQILAFSDRALKFLDLNLRKECYSDEIIDYSLMHCDILKLNEDELAMISERYNLSRNNDKKIEQLSNKFSIRNINLTLGAKGSILYKDGSFYRKNTGHGKVVDTVGAGDAFAAVLAVGIIKNRPPDSILDVASDFSARICQIKGAVPKDKVFYMDFKKEKKEFFQ
ncbi:MAG: hypothetical protein GY730_03730 [bacterium]|nr:hypothetical protein [bacterium]